jgi:hypothetical protein
MATYQAVGANPVSFVDGNQNQQEIPLTAITFGPNGPDASAWPSYTDNKSVIDALVKQLWDQGLLKAGTQNAPIPSLTVTAVTPGAIGNTIAVTFANPSAAAGTVDVTVSANEVYPGLAKDTIDDTLGTTAAKASGLVFVESNNDKAPKTFAGNISAGPSFNCLVPEPGGDPGGAFTLGATNPTNDPDAQLIKIAVDPDAAPATTFKLTVSWTKTAAAVTPAALKIIGTNPFAMLVTFSGPGAALPAAGTVTLLGGADATSSKAVPAKATVFSA